MKTSKKLFFYKNKIILINGSTLKRSSCKFFKNYSENFNFFKSKSYIFQKIKNKK
jgi:hypothetical protein